MTARRSLLAVLAVTTAFATAGCGRDKELVDGGLYITRTICPQDAIPAATGDITTFNPQGYTTSAAIDVVATITNLRSTCNSSGDPVLSTASFDVVATRRDAGAARTVVLPFFDVAMQGGNQVIAKRVGQVALNFAAGSLRAQTTSQGTIRVSRAATALPAAVRTRLTRERKAGDADAAIDPMSIPEVKAAVARATFEHLIGFELTAEQLRYNATR